MDVTPIRAVASKYVASATAVSYPASIAVLLNNTIVVVVVVVLTLTHGYKAVRGHRTDSNISGSEDYLRRHYCCVRAYTHDKHGANATYVYKTRRRTQE